MKKLLFLLLIFLFGKLAAQNNIQLSDIWLQYKFYAQAASDYNWLTDSTYIEILGDVTINSAVKEDQIVLIESNNLPDTLIISEVLNFELEENVIFTANPESLYRHSRKVYIMNYDLKLKKVTKTIEEKVYNPSLSSDKTKLAYTRENNLYVLDLKTWEEKQLTADGKWNFVLNGRSDWVYEEEFGFTKAFYWIKGTNKIAYLKFDESEVPTYDMQMWENGLYPTNYSYKYPKAGEENSEVSLHVIDTETSAQKTVFATGKEFEYISKIGMTKTDGTFYYIKMNRLQNKMELIEYDANSDTQRLTYSETSGKYIELPSGPYYNNNGFVMDTYKSGYRHFHQIEEGKDTDLTKGDFDVTGFKFYDEEEEYLYFTALYENSYTQSLCLSKGRKVKSLLKTTDWVEASVSPEGKYAIVTVSNLNKPYESNLYDLKELKSIKKMTDNSRTNTFMETLDLGETEFFNVKSEQGHEIPCFKILPPNFDKNKKYPVLMHCYGGPGHQVVTNQWNPFDYWYHQMIAQQGCIVVLADGRGTDGNGAEYRQASYGQFGDLEHQDQVTVANHFRNQSYVDSTRIGIWGWSYGGYLSSLCLMKSPEVFSTAIAVAPVTNWRFYDNIYTERYMGLPKDNALGYDQNSPTSYAKDLKGKYLLIHGTADDNVHVQNAISMQQALLRNNKQFDMFYYPDKNHGIYGGYTRYNLYQKMFTFMQQNLIYNGN